MQQSSGHGTRRLPAVCLAAALAAGACADESSPTATGPSGSSGGAPRVKLEAVVSGRSGSCPAIRFTLGGIRVETTASTQFALACERVADGASVEADAPRMTGDLLVAREVDMGDESVTDPDFEAEGPIDALSSAADCTAASGRTVTVLGLVFSAGSFTDFRDVSNGCSGLTAGATVRARGRLTNPPTAPAQPLRATRIERR